MIAASRVRSQGGLTLVELLVGMVVLSLVALTILGGLRFVARVFDDTDDRREALEELTLGFSVLRNELERAEPLMLKAGNEERVLFEGTPDRLRFVNVEPIYLAGLPYRVFEYAIVEDGDAYRIELRRGLLDPAELDLASVETVEPRVLIRTPQPLRFTYYGQRRRDERPEWHESWTRLQQLPTAVRLASGEEPGWPDLVVPLLIQAPWYCSTASRTSSAGCEPPR
jgi:general secretion pathway protein J